ncbi:hypothetical protein C8Q80DRAFT_324919 [Daedaleopsis nitida]|nr:hypothetical protein C8Q80DRAFT_324919 [Daedaleopsis nitida]
MTAVHGANRSAPKCTCHGDCATFARRGRGDSTAIEDAAAGGRRSVRGRVRREWRVGLKLQDVIEPGRRGSVSADRGRTDRADAYGDGDAGGIIHPGLDADSCSKVRSCVLEKAPGRLGFGHAPTSTRRLSVDGRYLRCWMGRGAPEGAEAGSRWAWRMRLREVPIGGIVRESNYRPRIRRRRKSVSTRAGRERWAQRGETRGDSLLMAHIVGRTADGEYTTVNTGAGRLLHSEPASECLSRQNGTDISNSARKVP